jgi:hypothetical protein
VREGLVVGFPGPEVADPTRGNNLIVGIPGAQRLVLLPITGEHLVSAQQQRHVLLSSILADQERSRKGAQMRVGGWGVGGGYGVSANEYRTAVHKSPNKLRRSNSIFNL